MTGFSLRIKDPKGSPENLLTPADVKEKFLKNTVPVIGADHANSFYDSLLQLDTLMSVRDLDSNFVSKSRLQLSAL